MKFDRRKDTDNDSGKDKRIADVIVLLCFVSSAGNRLGGSGDQRLEELSERKYRRGLCRCCGRCGCRCGILLLRLCLRNRLRNDGCWGGSGAGAGAGAGATGAAGAGAGPARGLPQPAQKVAPSGFSLPQMGQNIILLCLSPGACGRPTSIKQIILYMSLFLRNRLCFVFQICSMMEMKTVTSVLVLNTTM